MTNSKTKNFSQNVSSSYYLRGECSNECKKDSLNVPKLRFEGYNEEWKKIKLGEHLNICRGASPRPIEKYITMQSNGINWIKIGDISPKENVIKTTKEKITEEGAKHSRYVRKGDLILSNSMSFGRPYILEIDGCIHDGWLLIQDLEKLFDKKYLCYLLDSDTVKHQYRKYAAGGVVINLNSELVRSVSVFIPKVQEQEKIASFLTLIDKKIEKQKELIELLKKYKRGLLSQIFSQKLRFKDDNENNYPDWEEKTLGEVTNNISYGLNATAKKYDGKNKYIRITDIDETTGKYNKIDIVSPDCDLSDEYKLKINDLLFARTGASTGKTYLYDENDGEMYFAGFLIKFSIKEEYCSDFVFYITQTYNYKKWVSIMSARSGQPGINAKEYSKYKFFCPVLEEQVKISNIISKLDNIIEKENLQLNLYNDYKKGLLQQMFI